MDIPGVDIPEEDNPEVDNPEVDKQIEQPAAVKTSPHRHSV